MNRVFLCLIIILISSYFILTQNLFKKIEPEQKEISVQVMYEDQITNLTVKNYSTIKEVLAHIKLEDEMSLEALNLNEIVVDRDIIRIPKKQAVSCISLNTADLETLMMIKGVGEKTAQQIIDYRDKQGSYKSIEDLLNIKGIGEKKLEKMRAFLCL